MNRVVTLLRIGLLVFPLLLAACALTDVASTTPPPPITLQAPPSLNLSGNCDNSKNLEDWLQVSTILVSDFQTKMNDAAGKNRSDAYQPTVELVGLRDSAFGAVTPDCAVDAEKTLSDAMNQAVDALQSYVNGDKTDISSMIATVNNQFDQVTAAQNELIGRLNSQIRSQVQQLTATP